MNLQKQKVILIAAGIIFLATAAVLLHSFKGQFGKETKDVSSVPVLEETIDVSSGAQQAQTAPKQVTSTASLPSKWVVYVTGEVKKPGVYELPCDSRTYEALNAAGGFTSKADTEAVNLAAMLQDGVQIHFPAKGERAAPGSSVPVSAVQAKTTAPQPAAAVQTQPSGGQNVAATGGLININTATAEQLATIKGIGPKTAAAIIKYREENGGFSRIEDILQVKGIGSKKYDSIKGNITVGK